MNFKAITLPVFWDNYKYLCPVRIVPQALTIKWETSTHDPNKPNEEQ